VASSNDIEIDLFRAACRGDSHAFARLVDPRGSCCGARIVAAAQIGLAMKVTDPARRRSVLDDAVQEAMVEIWRNLDAFKFESAVCTWMYGVAYYRTLGFARVPARWHRHTDDTAVDVHDGALAVAVELEFSEDADLAERLLREIARTNQPGAEALLHKFWGDRTQTEIAQIMGLSEGTVSKRISKAYDHAARLLAEWETR
jgi:RNA polymerase sigma-70 factor (ECF subfamily)